MKRYKITLTEEQTRIVAVALEEYFRLRYGQSTDFANDICEIGTDLSPENPDHEHIFDNYIQRRDHVGEVMKCVFRIAFEPYGYLKEKPKDCMEAETIWDAIRTAKGTSHWGFPHQSGVEPIPDIEVISAH